MTARRPTDIEEFRAASANFVTEESLRQAREFVSRPTDLFISTYPKCGTTWMQQIVHALRTRGAMDFGEITEVTPWIELALDLDLDIHADQPRFRAYKSHLTIEDLPAGGRYLTVIRDPRDVLVSMYRFFDGWWFERGSISIDTLARERFMAAPQPRRYWYHVATWFEARERDDVLVFCYEDMKADLEPVIERIAGFVGIELDPELRAIVLEHASIEFMKAHGSQFDDHLVRAKRDAACGLPPGGQTTKVRTGRVGDHASAVSAEVIAELEAIWADEIKARLGFENYEALRGALANRAD